MGEGHLLEKGVQDQLRFCQSILLCASMDMIPRFVLFAQVMVAEAAGESSRQGLLHWREIVDGVNNRAPEYHTAAQISRGLD